MEHISSFEKDISNSYPLNYYNFNIYFTEIYIPNKRILKFEIDKECAKFYIGLYKGDNINELIEELKQHINFSTDIKIEYLYENNIIGCFEYNNYYFNDIIFETKGNRISNESLCIEMVFKKKIENE